MTSRGGDAARLARHDDIPGIVRLVGDYWSLEGIDGFDRDELAAQLDFLLSDRRLGDVWVTGTPDSLAGYLVAVYVFSLEHKGLTAEIDEFYVAPGCRGRGLGQVLLAAAEARFRDLHCTNVSLATRPGQPRREALLSGPRLRGSRRIRIARQNACRSPRLGGGASRARFRTVEASIASNRHQSSGRVCSQLPGTLRPCENRAPRAGRHWPGSAVK